jgi:hypothetical protein
MRNPLREGLLKNQEPRLKPPYPPEFFGDPVAGGTLDSGEGCWDVAGELRSLYDTTIHPRLCERLFAIFGTASISDWITLPVYMVGHNRNNALPTVMVCSEDEAARKKAKKELRKSAFLKDHAKFKVISVSTDPGIQGELEQLASGTAGHKHDGATQRATKVLVDKTKPLNPQGIEIWIDHGQALRPATAFVEELQDRLFLRTVHHAFVETAARTPKSGAAPRRKAPVHVDSESESDSESDDEDELNVAITSIGSQSPDAWSGSGSESSSLIFSGKSTPSIFQLAQVENVNTTLLLSEISSRLAPFSSLPKIFPVKEIAQPAKEKLVLLGRLTFWSKGKDWALIEIVNEEICSQLERPSTKSAISPKSHSGPSDNAEVVAYTSSNGVLSGTIAGPRFCTRLPNSSSFHDVYRVRLNGPLANGDCGTAVRDSTTGEFYGHIVAGCRSTGTAYIMAAHQIQADFATLDIGSLDDRTLKSTFDNVSKHVVKGQRGTLRKQTDCQQQSNTHRIPISLSNEGDYYINGQHTPQTKATQADSPQNRLDKASSLCIGILYRTLEHFGLLSGLTALLAFIFDTIQKQFDPVSDYEKAVFYVALLALVITPWLSVRLGAVLDNALAYVKIGFILSNCILGYMVSTRGETKQEPSITRKVTAYSFSAASAATNFLTRRWRMSSILHFVTDPVDAIAAILCKRQSMTTTIELSAPNGNLEDIQPGDGRLKLRQPPSTCQKCKNKKSYPRLLGRKYYKIAAKFASVGFLLYWSKRYTGRMRHPSWHCDSWGSPYPSMTILLLFVLSNDSTRLTITAALLLLISCSFPVTILWNIIRPHASVFELCQGKQTLDWVVSNTTPYIHRLASGAEALALTLLAANALLTSWSLPLTSLPPTRRVSIRHYLKLLLLVVLVSGAWVQNSWTVADNVRSDSKPVPIRVHGSHQTPSWAIFSLGLLVSSILAMCLVYPKRESSRWLIKHGKYKQALETFLNVSAESC